MDAIISVAIFIWNIVAGLTSAIFGMAAGILHILAEYIVACVKVLFTHPDELPARAHEVAVPADREKAKINYFYGPARSDFRYIWQVSWERWQDAADWWGGNVSELMKSDAPLAFTAPIAIGLAIGLIVAVPVAAVPMSAIWIAGQALLALATAGVRGSVKTLRFFDSGWLFIRHIRVRCIACFERIPYPAYLCPQCRETHWDIRPGRYGVLRRTCECGQRMPTLLLLGTAKLDAICSRRGCGQPLEYGPGETREIILPLFGPKGAGKTLLMWGIVKTLQQSVRPGVRVDYADSDTAAHLRDLDAAIAAGARVPATPAARPKAYVIRLRVGRHKRILQLPDPAGELFYDSKHSKDLLYLGAASTFILVIDPLSINDFWANIPSARQSQLVDYRSVAPHPDQIYQQTAERIMQMGKRRAQRRLAIVLSRSDLVEAEYGSHIGEDDGIRKWMEDELGLAGLLRDAEADFGKERVTLFRTAPFGTDNNNLQSLVHWVMREELHTYTGSEPD